MQVQPFISPQKRFHCHPCVSFLLILFLFTLSTNSYSQGGASYPIYIQACYGTSDLPITLSWDGNGGTLVDWEREISGSGTWVSLGTNANPLNDASTYTAGVTYRYRAKINTGPIVYSNYTTLVVYAASEAATATVAPTDAANRCPGDNVVSVNLGAPYTGNVEKWVYAYSSSGPWIDFNSTATSITDYNLTKTTYYKAVVKNGTCASVQTTATATVTVIDEPVMGDVTPDATSLCTGSVTTLRVTNHSASNVYWEENTGIWTSLGSGANYSLTAPQASVGNHTIRCSVSNGTCKNAAGGTVEPTAISSSFIIPVYNNTQTANPAADNVVSYNDGTTRSLTVTTPLGDVKRWEYSYDGATWTSISNTTTTLNYNNLLQTTKYRAVFQNGVCSEAASPVPATITVANGGTLTTDGSSFCLGAVSGNLTVSSLIGTAWIWERSTDAAFSVPVNVQNNGLTLAFSGLTADTWYRVNINSGKAYSNAVKITVSTASVAGTVTASAPVVCSSNPTVQSLSLAGNTGSIVRWESSVSNGAPWSAINSTSSPLNYNNLIQTTWYRAIVKNGACAEAATPTVQVLVAAGGSVAPDYTVCSGIASGYTINLSGQSGVVSHWEKQEYTGSWGVWASIGNGGNASYTLPSLTLSTRYKAVITSTCASPVESGYTEITVSTPSNGGTVSGSKTVRPASNTGNVTLAGTTHNVIRWESSVTPSGGAPWTSISNTSYTLPYTNLSTTTYYRAIVKNGACAETASSNMVTITVADAGSVSSNTTVCSSDASVRRLDLVGSVGTVDRWQYSVDNAASWNNIASSGGNAFINFSNLTQTTLYRAVIREDAGDIFSQYATVTVNPRPVINFSNNTACLASATNFTDLTTIASGTVLDMDWDFGDNTYSGAQNPSHTYTAAGNYNVKLTVSSQLGCDSSITKTITVKPKPYTNFAFSNTCKGVTVDYTNQSSLASNTLSYVWSLGDATTSTSTNPSKIYATAGTYSIKLKTTAQNGCIDSSIQSITIYPLPTPDFTFSNICAGSNASFTNASYLPQGNLTYLWTLGSVATSTLTNPVQTFASSGDNNIKLLATSQYGCHDSVTKVLTVHPNPTANFTVSNNCHTQNTVFTDNSSISSGTLSWNWDYGNGATSAIQSPTYVFPNMGSFLVKLTVTSNNGCTNSFSKSVEIYPVPSLNYTFDNVCANDTARFKNLTTISGGTLTHKWTFGDNTSETNLNTIHNYALAGSYNVKLLATSNLGCKDSLTKTIVIYPVPVPDFTANNACLLQWVNYANTSTVASGSIASSHWDFGNGFTSNLTNTRFAYSEPGTYNASLRVTSNYACVASVSKNVIVTDRPTANFIQYDVCSNISRTFDNKSLVYTPTVQYNWSFGDGFGNSSLEDPDYTYASSGIFDVKLLVTDANGCKDSITREVVAHPRAIPGFEFDTACQSVPLNFSNTTVFTQGTMRYTWFFKPEVTSNNAEPTYTFDNYGVYPVKLEITTDRGCIDFITKNVNVHKKPQVLFRADNECLNYTTEFENLSTELDGNITWLWDFGDQQSSPLDKPTHLYKTPGTYLVELEAISEFGCSNNYLKNIEVYPQPYANYNHNIVCEGQQVSFDNISNILSGTISYNWSFGNDSVSTNPLPKMTYYTTGSYKVKLTATSNYGCIDSITKTLVVSPLPNTLYDALVVCRGFPTVFTNKTTVASGSVVYFQWNFGDLSNSLQESPVHQYVSSGVYNSSLLCRTDKGCEKSYSREITIAPVPSANFQADPVCHGDPTQFIDKTVTQPGSTGVLLYDWDFGTDVSTLTNPKYIFHEPGIHEVKLVTTYNNTQCADSISKQVYVYRIPDVNAGEDIEISKGYPYTMQGTASQGSYNWTPAADLSSPKSLKPVLTANTTNNFILQVISPDGCINSDTVLVSVKEDYNLYKLDVTANNVLTPDGNNQNDVWRIENIELYPDNSLEIFDRWGNRVYSVKGYKNDWAGTNVNGDPLTDGTYYFVVYFKKSSKVHKGAITLLRGR